MRNNDNKRNSVSSESIFCHYCKLPVTSRDKEELENGYHKNCRQGILTFEKDERRVLAKYEILKNDFPTIFDKYSIYEILKEKELFLIELNLKDLPESIEYLDQLTSLDLSNNHLTDLPNKVKNLGNLEFIELDSNNFTELPKILLEIPTLFGIGLANNKLTQLPLKITNLDFFEFINLKNNYFTDFPESLCNISTLTDLDLSYNKLTHIPKEIGKLDSLSILNLEHNKLQSLPDELSSLRLNELYIGYNELEYLPEELFITNTLQLGGNKFKSIPKVVLGQRNLINFTMDDTHLRKLPLQLFRNNAFYSLSFIDCDLEEIPREMFTPRLSELDLDHNNLTKIPWFLENQYPKYGMSHLNLSHNKITELPIEIAKIKSIGVLEISNNPIKTLPDSIGDSGIAGIYANNTNISYLPDSIGNSPLLHHLRLNNTHLESLPEFLIPDQYIGSIDIRNTPIETLPESINSIDLRTLFISEEKLKKYITNPNCRVVVNSDKC